MLAALVGWTGCKNDETEPADEPVDIVVTTDVGPEVETPDSAVEVADDTEDVSEPDTADAGSDADEDIPFVVPTPPETPLRRWAPVVEDDIVATVDLTGVRAGLIGLPPFELDTFVQGTEASSPVIVAGLECWDIDGDGVFTAAKEDFNGDGVGDFLDCEFHPDEIPTGVVGVVVAVHPPGGQCELRAYTATGKTSWVTPFAGTCRQPARVGSSLLLPLTAGSQGTVRIVRIRDGVLGNQVVLPGAPTTPPARLGDSRFIIGYAGGDRKSVV